MADSLEQVYRSRDFPAAGQFQILLEIARNQTDTDQKLHYSDTLIALAESVDSIGFMYYGYLEKGNALRLKADLTEALQQYFLAAKIAEDHDLLQLSGIVNTSIADVYSVMGNSANAELYYDKAIELLRTTTDSVSLANTLLNAGDEYFNTRDFEKALAYFRESGLIYEKVGFTTGTAYNKGNMGMVHAEMGEEELALSHINEAISILEELEDYYPISVYLTYMSDIYRNKGDYPNALGYAERSLELASSHGLKDQMGAAHLTLSRLYEQMGNTVASFEHYRDHIAYRDSVKNVESVQQMANLRTNYEVAQKQVEVDLLNQQKRTQKIIAAASAIGLFLIGILAIGLYRRNKFIQKTKQIIEEEKNRSEALLLNILPEETARELKEKGRVAAKKFTSVTVLFTDFKDFTKSAERVAPEQLVESIDFYFKAFDAITTKYDLEKIKTIGDSYMCAGGLPETRPDHAKRVVMAAREMIEVVAREQQASNQRLHFEVRIGVHTGPVVAGIVGDKKWQYDIWGDTVNIASRMETNSVPGRVNVSETTYSLIKEEFPCKYRGKIEVKNRGPLKMFFVN